jgi:hypothetical protein
MIDAAALRDDRPDAVATFHPDGQLATLRVSHTLEDMTKAIVLSLAPAQLTGRAETIETIAIDPNEAPRPYEGYGHDNDPVEITPQSRYERWVRDWIERAYELEMRKGFFCSFCEKSQQEVLKLIAGPTVCICNECIALCNEILNEGGVQG